MNEASEVIDQIRQIQIQYRAEVGSSRRAWPASIRRRIEQLSAMGMSFKEISDKTGVPYYSIMNWRHGRRLTKNFHALAVTNPKSPEPVATVTVAKAEPEQAQFGAVLVTTPDGYLIEIRDPRLVVEIIKSVRGQG